MSLKYSTTTADYLRWDEMSNLVRRLSRDGDYKMSLLIAIGCFWGLRISDILSLRWKDILNVDEFTLQEKKTKKNRTIRINPQLKRHIAECYDHIQPIGINSPILVSQKGTTYSVQRINVILKEIKAKYKLKVQHFSCHSLRKTFGRQVYNQNAENAELALVKLMDRKKYCRLMTVFPFRWLIFQLKSLTHKTLFVTLWQFYKFMALNLYRRTYV